MISIIDLALARGLEPVYVWIQKTSFLAEHKETEGKGTIGEELTMRAVPVYPIQYGSDIKECLENGNISQEQGIQID